MFPHHFWGIAWTKKIKINTDTSYDKVKFKYLDNISIPTAEASQWALIVS